MGTTYMDFSTGVFHVDGDAPQRKRFGAPERITTTRTIPVNQEVRAVLVLGDDLRSGQHVITFAIPPGKKACRISS